MHHYILTRFSIFDPKTEVFRLTRKSKKAATLRSKLYSPRRLHKKFEFFERVTYPSIMSQTCPTFTWLLYTSQELPAIYKKRLQQHENERVKVVFVKSILEMREDIRKRINSKTNISTIRLDDDDGLHPKFLERLNKYTKHNGSIISMPNGRYFRIEKGVIQDRGATHVKKIAAGLTAIGFSIFEAGDHTTVDDRYPVVYDKMKDAYYVSCSSTSDTKRRC